jgi:recombination protein RecT
MFEREDIMHALAVSAAKHLTPERLTRIVMQALAKTPKLQECTQQSLLASVFQACFIGLEPNGPTNEAYLVPFWNKNVPGGGAFECQLMPSYRGLIKLARNSGDVSLFYSHIVHENDEFALEYGDAPHVTHKPLLEGERGKIRGAYACVKFKDGSTDVEWMSFEELERLRKISKNADGAIWKDHAEEMYRKAPIRRLQKRVPCSVEMSAAVDLDNKIASAQPVDYTEIFASLGKEPPPEATGEAPKDEPAADRPKPEVGTLTLSQRFNAAYAQAKAEWGEDLVKTALGDLDGRYPSRMSDADLERGLAALKSLGTMGGSAAAGEAPEHVHPSEASQEKIL